MSEPDGAFLKLRIARPDLVRWLDSPTAPASRWLDWRALAANGISTAARRTSRPSR